jgi:demethylmenaquinone methyltransferase / 2-methoxy-6-polyprenyl-1,4-benzoquinol methylase
VKLINSFEPGIISGKRRLLTIPTSTSKELQIQRFFHDIAGIYDLTNTLTSFGVHNYWRRTAVTKTDLPKGGLGLDVCCGTGKITMDLARKTGPRGKIIGLDFSENMLSVARRHLDGFDFKNNVELVCGNAMDLPFPDNTFDCAITGYGLRNVLDMKKTLLEMKRVVKPGGRVVSLELAKPYLPVFKQIYLLYMSRWVPLVGQIVAKNKEAYRYLYHSMVAYPHQNEVTRIYRELGFENPQCYELTWGIAAVHVGVKPDHD